MCQGNDEGEARTSGVLYICAPLVVALSTRVFGQRGLSYNRAQAPARPQVDMGLVHCNRNKRVETV